MELIVIGESRLKIMLTGEEMVKYDLGAPDTVEADPHTREALRHIFADARASVGFNTEGDRLFVQMYASRGGGCEIFVTKLGGTGEDTLLALLGADGRTAAKRFCLALDELDHLSALCRRLLAAGFRGESAVYISEGADRWYLILQTTAHDGVLPYLPAILSEYGEIEDDRLALFLAEHGRLLCGNGALEVLAPL